jgi:tetratricopeptide (TPR) repeat protein
MRFVTLLGIPLVPVGHLKIMDECPHCGFRGTVSARRYLKDKKKRHESMMRGFSEDPDNPDNCAQALHNLMVYNEHAWFHDIRKSYGMRFETSMTVQHVIAEGLCRFGDYEQAISYCRKALVLGAGPRAEELLATCLHLQESVPALGDLNQYRLYPESIARACIPGACLAGGIGVIAVSLAVSMMNTHHAWLINASLQPYEITLNNKPYTLEPGSRRKIKLRKGDHTLQMEGMPVNTFSYSLSLLSQLFNRNLLVINPDGMGVFNVKTSDGGSETVQTMHTQQIHAMEGIGFPLFGFQSHADDAEADERISLYRPNTHMELVGHLRELDLDAAAAQYARRALTMNPATPEAELLLPYALSDESATQVRGFLAPGLALSPPLLTWHCYHQDFELLHGSRDALRQEYIDRCKSNPNQPEGFYLLGRILKNKEEARKYYLHAEKLGIPGLGYTAIAEDLFYAGRFADALEFSKQALSASGKQEDSRRLHRQILFALRRYDELLADPDDLPPDDLVACLTCAGYHNDAEQKAIQLSQGSVSRLSLLNARRFYAVGNLSAYFECLAGTGNTHYLFEGHVTHNRISDAADYLETERQHVWWDHLVMYCAAMSKKDGAVADIHLKKAADEAGVYSPDRLLISGMLMAEEPPAIEDLRQLRIEPVEKSLLCTALGFRHPERREQYMKTGAEYNFSQAFPQHLLRQWYIPKSKPQQPAIKPAA